MMKYLRDIVLLLILLFAISINAFAADSFTYSAEAQKLNDLGLYKGISTTEFDPDLGTALNRETGVVMLLRIFGLESEAQAITDADATLAKFTDASSIASWAKNATAYAVKNGLVQGLPDGTFGPKASLNGKAYCTLILRQLGYTPDYNNAPAELADKGGLSVLESVKFTEKELIKDDLIGISYGALKAEYGDGATVIQKLLDGGIVEEKKVEDAGFKIQTPIEILPAEPKVQSMVVTMFGTDIIVTFDKSMTDASDKSSEFLLKINNKDVEIKNITLDKDNPKILDFRFSYDIYAEDDVTLSYTKGTVKAEDGGLLNSFSLTAVNKCFMKRQ
ncbi:MAG: S-layer homology domain-containing protein [Ignavibacteriales bacterium]